MASWVKRLASFHDCQRSKEPRSEEIHGLADGRITRSAWTCQPRPRRHRRHGRGRLRTVNISTMSAFVLVRWASLVKHGNRGVSGSADVIEALGVNLDVEVDQLRSFFDRVGIAFPFSLTNTCRCALPPRCAALGFPAASACLVR